MTLAFDPSLAAVNAIALRKRLLNPANRVADKPIDLARRIAAPSKVLAPLAEEKKPVVRRLIDSHTTLQERLDQIFASSLPCLAKIITIQRVVCAFYDIRIIDLLCERRSARIVRPRQIAMYLAKTLTPRSLPEIGRRFGGRDHTTVLHAVRKIERLLQDDSELREQVSKIETSVLSFGTGTPAAACAE